MYIVIQVFPKAFILTFSLYCCWWSWVSERHFSIFHISLSLTAIRNILLSCRWGTSRDRRTTWWRGRRNKSGKKSKSDGQLSESFRLAKALRKNRRQASCSPLTPNLLFSHPAVRWKPGASKTHPSGFQVTMDALPFLTPRLTNINEPIIPKHFQYHFQYHFSVPSASLHPLQSRFILSSSL